MWADIDISIRVLIIDFDHFYSTWSNFDENIVLYYDMRVILWPRYVGLMGSFLQVNFPFAQKTWFTSLLIQLFLLWLKKFFKYLNISFIINIYFIYLFFIGSNFPFYFFVKLLTIILSLFWDSKKNSKF